MHPYLLSFVGGLLVGLAVWFLLSGIGRIAGVSGIMASALANPRAGAWRFAFLGGLIGGGLLFVRVFNVAAPPVASTPWLIAAGLLVGFGTVVSGGCTSGHGVCGLGRRSARSLVATLVFMVCGAVTVAVIRLGH